MRVDFCSPEQKGFTRHHGRFQLLTVVACTLVIVPGFAATIAVDENGNSQVSGIPGVSSLPFAKLPDPGPGGAASVLTYTLPVTTAIGDVTFVSASDPGIFFGGDVVRFNGRTLVFYSDTVAGDPSESLADTAAPPGALYTNVATAVEIGPDANNRALYTPLPGQPGYSLLADGTTVSYVLVSDGSIPEPASLLLMATGLGFLCVVRFPRGDGRLRWFGESE